MKRKVLLSMICGVSMLCLITGCGNKGMLNNPKDVDVESVIKTISGVKSTCLVTEENDPNGQLNKSGGYTGVVYFRLTQVDEKVAKDEYSTSYGNDACKEGNSGGGAIEIYANENDAKKRNDYLGAFDGGMLASFHSVRGTLVIRLSEKLTATQQKELEEEIYNALNK